MKYLVVIEYETCSPLVLFYDDLGRAEALYSTNNMGKRITLFILQSMGLIEVYQEMKTRTEA